MLDKNNNRHTCNGVMLVQESDIVDVKLIVDGKYITPVHEIREVDLCINMNKVIMDINVMEYW